jgi:excinuclease UvrABC ATPase subunit
MSMAKKTDAQSPALHGADSYDLIRVHGACVNNLKDVSVELPKRRLTVFTGVSGSGKSSLVFGTIAAESQRMINETYSAFVQGFMPKLARPEVDLLEGLTTAILVDQERMGANARSTVGTQRSLGQGERCHHRRARCRQDEDREGDLHPSRRHGATAISSRSTAGCATNASTSTCSGHWLRRGW